MQRIEDAVDCINSVNEVVSHAIKGHAKAVIEMQECGISRRCSQRLHIAGKLHQALHCYTKSIADVAPKASQAHFGAVFSTSATTIVGLMPMLSETNLQAQILIPLVTSRCFGLLVSTVLVYFWCLLHMLS